MIYLLGDRHIDQYFANLDIPHMNCHQPNITMYRIGRDGVLINFKDKYASPESIFVISYGEIDCRCHIYKQEQLGLNYKDICNILVNNYFNTIFTSIKTYKSIVICSIPPAVKLSDYEINNNTANDEFPFMGSDEMRIEYVRYMNTLLEAKSKEYGYTFLYINDHYSLPDGSFNYNLSDKSVHVSKQKNKYILDLFKSMLT